MISAVGFSPRTILRRDATHTQFIIIGRGLKPTAKFISRYAAPQNPK